MYKKIILFIDFIYKSECLKLVNTSFNFKRIICAKTPRRNLNKICKKGIFLMLSHQYVKKELLLYENYYKNIRKISSLPDLDYAPG